MGGGLISVVLLFFSFLSCTLSFFFGVRVENAYPLTSYGVCHLSSPPFSCKDGNETKRRNFELELELELI